MPGCPTVGATRLCALLLLGAASASAQQGVRRSFGPLSVTIPSGWVEQATKDGPRFLTPDSTPQAYFAVVFYPAHQTPDDLRAHHALLWNKLLAVVSATGPSQSGTVGHFIWSGVQVRGTTGQSVWVRTYSAKVGLTFQAVGVEATSPILLSRHLPEVEAMLASATAEDVARASPAPTPAGPKAGVPSKIPTLPAKDVKVVEAYLQSAIQQRFSVGTGVKQSAVAEDILLFENGVAYRAEVLSSGIDSTANAYGYATVDVADMKDPPGRHYGRWTQDRDAGTLTITWFGGHVVNYRRKGKDLLLEGGSATRRETMDGLRLDGHFEAKQIGPPIRLVLHKDGRFEEELLVNVLGGSIIDPTFPEKGAGTYEVFKWTLILRFADGTVRTANLKYDPAKPDALLLHTRELKRVG
jgi:hypothetical protein